MNAASSELTRYPSKNQHTGRFEKISFTPKQDQIIRDSWSSGLSNQAAANHAAQLTGQSVGACSRRACQIGVYSSVRSCRHEAYEWGDEELKVVEQYSAHSLLMIQQKLRAVGSHRTLPSITRQLRKHQFRAMLGLNHTDLAAALGVCSNTLLRWRREKKIKANWLPTVDYLKPVRGSRKGQRGGAHEDHAELTYLNPAIKRFLLRFPNLVDLRRVDQVWFMDLIAHT